MSRWYLCALGVLLLGCGSVDADAPPADDAGSVACTLPAPGASCQDLIQEEVIEFVYCRQAAYLPVEMSYGGIGFWWAPCSSSAAETKERALDWTQEPIAEQGDIVEILSVTSDTRLHEVMVRFYEATATGDSHDVAYRNTRCDYFDNDVLNGKPFESATPLVELASYLWYIPECRNRGSHVLLALPGTTPTGFRVSLCHTSMANGDYGTYDEIGLKQTDYELDSTSGQVVAGEPQTIWSAQGKFNPAPY